MRKFIETIEFFNYGSEKYHRKISFKFVKSALFRTFVNICNLYNLAFAEKKLAFQYKTMLQVIIRY